MEKIVEVERPVEVEKIVTVEVVKEVEKPVEVIKTVEVEKIVEVPTEDPTKIEELNYEVQRLLQDLAEKDQELAFRSKTENVLNAIRAQSDFELKDEGTASFGTTWPPRPARGDLFLKVDTFPNKLFKWNARKWIEIDVARIDDTLVYDPAYIDYIIQEVRKGHREYDDLSDIEKKQIMARIRDKKD